MTVLRSLIGMQKKVDGIAKASRDEDCDFLSGNCSKQKWGYTVCKDHANPLAKWDRDIQGEGSESICMGNRSSAKHTNIVFRFCSCGILQGWQFDEWPTTSLIYMSICNLQCGSQLQKPGHQQMSTFTAECLHGRDLQGGYLESPVRLHWYSFWLYGASGVMGCTE